MLHSVRDRLRYFRAWERNTPADIPPARATDLRRSMARAAEAFSLGDPDAAEALVTQATHDPGATADERAEVLRVLADAFVTRGNHRAAATVYLYLRDPDAVSRTARESPRDLARAARLAGDPVRAAKHFEAGEHPAHAALAWEDARRWTDARRCWEVVSRAPSLDTDPYVAGLVAFNLGRVCVSLRDPIAAGACWARSRAALSAALRRAEATGCTERQTDTLMARWALALEAGWLDEALDAGTRYVHILVADDVAEHAGPAAAAVARLAIRAGRPGDAAALLTRVAKAMGDTSPDLRATIQARAARAWREQVEAARRVGDEAGRAVAAQAEADALLAGRGARNEGTEHGLDTYEPHPVWHEDVLGWENRGDAEEVLGDLLLEDLPDCHRPRVLFGRLTGLSPAAVAWPVALARQVARLSSHYAVAAVLETLYASEVPAVRAATIREGWGVDRVARLVVRATADSDPTVRDMALQTIRRGAIAPAVSVLRRAYARTEDPALHAALVEGAGFSGLARVARWLVGRLEHGDAAERAAVTTALENSPAESVPLLLAEVIARGGEAADNARQALSIWRARRAVPGGPDDTTD